MITNESIIRDVERFCRERGIAETTFGKRTVNDGKLVARLRDGKSISLDTYNKIQLVIETGASEAAE